MTRLLGLVVLAVILWLVLEAALVRLRLSAGARVRPVQAPARPPEVAATLVRCSGCGVHVPQGSVVDGLCERCGPHPRPLSQPHARTTGRGESARS